MTVFTKIINRELPAKIIYEDHDYLAFFDLSQVTKGHTLVIPKKASKSVLDTEPEVIAQVNIIAQNLAKELIKKFNAKGVNIITNANSVAGQTVDHYHVHIIPRYHKNDITFKTSDQKLNIDDVYLEYIKE